MELRRRLFFLVAIGLSLSPLPIFARSITQVIIEAVGQSDIHADPPSQGCKQFRPTENQIRQYFSKAYPVPAKVGAQMRYSPCYARGKIAFSDTTRGAWKISSGGAATLSWDTGDVVTLFYNGYGWFDPFAGMYGLQ
jgi:hypothetical protein